MKLILDTSASKMQIILAKNPSQIASCNQIFDKHQKHLLPELDKLLQNTSCKLEDITTTCVVVGPGSFTGIRLSVATAKALSYVFSSIKVLPINMLELLSFKVEKTTLDNYLIAIKCTSTKVYTLSKINGKITMQTLTNFDASCLAKNNNLAVFSFNLDYLPDCKLTPAHLEVQDYVDFVFTKNESDFVSAQKLEPLYMALSQAEEELLKKEAKC